MCFPQLWVAAGVVLVSRRLTSCQSLFAKKLLSSLSPLSLQWKHPPLYASFLFLSLSLSLSQQPPTHCFTITGNPPPLCCVIMCETPPLSHTHTLTHTHTHSHTLRSMSLVAQRRRVGVCVCRSPPLFLHCPGSQ